MKVFSFIIKGKSSEVKKGIEALFKITDPKEIMEQTSEYGKIIFMHANKQMKEYNALLSLAKTEASRKKMLVFTYTDAKTSFTKELANELCFLYPKKLIIVAREKGEELKMSLRGAKFNIPQILEKALINVRGYGGGHEHACGGCVAKEDFERFIENLRREL